MRCSGNGWIVIELKIPRFVDENRSSVTKLFSEFFSHSHRQTVKCVCHGNGIGISRRRHCSWCTPTVMCITMGEPMRNSFEGGNNNNNSSCSNGDTNRCQARRTGNATSASEKWIDFRMALSADNSCTLENWMKQRIGEMNCFAEPRWLTRRVHSANARCSRGTC